MASKTKKKKAAPKKRAELTEAEVQAAQAVIDNLPHNQPKSDPTDFSGGRGAAEAIVQAAHNPVPEAPPAAPSEWQTKYVSHGQGWWMYRLKNVKSDRCDVYVIRPYGRTDYTWQPVRPDAFGVSVQLPYTVWCDDTGKPTGCACMSFQTARTDDNGRKCPCKHMRATFVLRQEKRID